MWSAFISIQNNKAITKATWNNRHSTCIFTVAPTDCKRGKLCPRRFNNLKFFLLISRCDVCRLTHSGQQPCCVSRTSSLFHRNRNPSHHLCQTIRTYQGYCARRFPFPGMSPTWMICSSALKQRTAADHLATVFTLMHSKWVGWERDHWAVRLLIPPLPFPFIVRQTLCVFQSLSCVSFCFCCNECMF